MKIYCEKCGSKLKPDANQTRFSAYTGKPLFALWLYCMNKDCVSVIYGARVSELVKSDVEEEEAALWVGRNLTQRALDEKPASVSLLQKLLAVFRQ